MMNVRSSQSSLEQPHYTEDITVAGSLLFDKVQSLYESITKSREQIRFSLMDLEKLPNLAAKVEKVQLSNRFAPRQSVVGVLYITTTHIIFVEDESGKEIWVLHSHVGRVERGPLSVSGCSLVVRCKHFLTLSFVISRDKDCQDVFDTLSQCSQPMNLEDVYAFSYVPAKKETEKSAGWTDTDAEILAEFSRQGVPNDYWMASDFNENYQYCDTYPRTLFVPNGVPKQILIGSCKFRSRNRLPVLAYYCERTKVFQSAICRCSQPLAGFSARCVEDEQMMQYILRVNPNKTNALYLVDTRPKMNAMANKAAGKGYEDTKNYANLIFQPFPIENIHYMRSSLQKVIEICHKPRPTADFLKGLDSSGWLKQIRLVLDCGQFIASSVEQGNTVVVHCSDGWDRTAQTISIASLLLDPFYRTCKGFQKLMEKDWLWFGHKFSDRCGHAGNSPDEESPIFTLFLDCVHQLQRQFPRAFEFGERFLIELHDQLFSCQFGTFLGNCDMDRRDLRLNERTYSLWVYLDANWSYYVNPFYLPNTHDVMLPISFGAHTIFFWRSMYNRFDNGVHPRESVLQSAWALKSHVDVLEDHLHVLQQRLSDLKTAAATANSEPMADSGHGSAADSHENGAGVSSSLAQLGESVTSLDLSDVSAELAGAFLATRWQTTKSGWRCANCLAGFGGAVCDKVHCFKCGLLHCRRCIEERPVTFLPALSASFRSCFVCKNCDVELTKHHSRLRQDEK